MFDDPCPGFTPEWPDKFEDLSRAELERRLERYSIYEKDKPGSFIGDIFKIRDRLAELKNRYDFS